MIECEIIRLLDSEGAIRLTIFVNESVVGIIGFAVYYAY